MKRILSILFVFITVSAIAQFDGQGNFYSGTVKSVGDITIGYNLEYDTIDNWCLPNYAEALLISSLITPMFPDSFPSTEYWISGSKWDDEADYYDLSAPGGEAHSAPKNNEKVFKAVRVFYDLSKTKIVGDFGEAGYIYRVVPSGEYYECWEVALETLGTSVWSNLNRDYVEVSDDVGFSCSNTDEIINQVGHTNSAAQVCRDYYYLVRRAVSDNDLYLGNINSLKINGDTLYGDIIIVGENNTITESGYSVIIGGSNNSVINSTTSAILAGANNTIDSTVLSSVVFGYNNKVVASARNSSIIAGLNNTLRGTYYSSIISGNGITGTKRSTAYASNIDVKDTIFSQTGLVQIEDSVLHINLNTVYDVVEDFNYGTSGFADMGVTDKEGDYYYGILYGNDLGEHTGTIIEQTAIYCNPDFNNVILEGIEYTSNPEITKVYIVRSYMGNPPENNKLMIIDSVANDTLCSPFGSYVDDKNNLILGSEFWDFGELEPEVWTIPSTINDTTENYYGYVNAKNYIAQFHRIDSIDVATADVFIDVKFDTLIANESTTGYAFNTDSTGFIVDFTGISRVQGCGHWFWSGGENEECKLYIRVLVNGVEARCLQANDTRARRAGEDGTLPFIGTIYHNANDEIKVQYQVTNFLLDWEGSAIFDNAISFSVNFERISN